MDEIDPTNLGDLLQDTCNKFHRQENAQENQEQENQKQEDETKTRKKRKTRT